MGCWKDICFCFLSLRDETVGVVTLNCDVCIVVRVETTQTFLKTRCEVVRGAKACKEEAIGGEDKNY